MNHQIRVGLTRTTPNEAPRFEVIAHPRPVTGEPLQTDPWAPTSTHIGSHRDRLRAGVLNVDLQMILEIRTHSGKILHDVDAGVARICVAHSGDDVAAAGGLAPT